MSQKVIVIGGGIGGLCTAVAPLKFICSNDAKSDCARSAAKASA